MNILAYLHVTRGGFHGIGVYEKYFSEPRKNRLIVTLYDDYFEYYHYNPNQMPATVYHKNHNKKYVLLACAN